MTNKVMVVGTGNVGANVAFSLVNQRTAVNELVLTDINAADAEGEAMDLSDAIAVAPSYMKIKAGTYADAADCDIIIITAGVPQKPGESRMDLLAKNAAIFKDMIGQIMASGFYGIFIVVSNPMDVLTYLTFKYSGLPADHVIGSGTVLDSARLRQRIAKHLDVHPKSVHAYQIGEHGDTEFALWSAADVGGQPVSSSIPTKTLEEIEDQARTEAYAIIEKKGATYYGIGVCTVSIINAILNNERRVLPVSCYDDFSNCYYGYPAVVGRQGIARRLNLKLTEEEGIKLQKSINALKEAIKTVGSEEHTNAEDNGQASS